MPTLATTDAKPADRAARERLRRVDSLLAALLAELQRNPDPQNAQEPAPTPEGRLPQHSKTLDNNTTNPAARSAQTRNAGAVHSVRGEDPCAP